MAANCYAQINAFICALIVIVLMFCQRGDARHRPGISLLAYPIVPLGFLFSQPRGLADPSGASRLFSSPFYPYSEHL